MQKYEIIKKFYESELKSDPKKFEVMGWESREAQFQRFSVLSSYRDIHNKKILDVGCGKGDLLEHFKEQNIDCNYTGVDILDSMIEIAKKEHPESEFHCADIFSNHPFEYNSFDIIYTSGIFNLNMGNNLGFIKSAIKTFYSLSKSTIVFNLLHKNSPNPEEKFFYVYPDQVIRMIEDLNLDFGSIQLVEHYLKNDFTIIISKEQTCKCIA